MVMKRASSAAQPAARRPSLVARLLRSPVRAARRLVPTGLPAIV